MSIVIRGRDCFAVVCRRLLPAGADETSDKTADDSRAEGYPPLVMVVSAMMVVVAIVPGRWRRAVFRDVVSWCGLRGVTSAAAWSCHCRGAERETCEGKNHEFFECLVHNAPSLSCFGFARASLPLTER